MEEEDIVRCQKCGAPVKPEEVFNFEGQVLCEDCYVEMASRPKPCDPAAVSAARAAQLVGQGGAGRLTEFQRRIYDFLQAKGRATREELARTLGTSVEEVERHFAVLRHLELVRAFKGEDGNVYLTTMR
jgi:hypothetical protein